MNLETRVSLRKDTDGTFQIEVLGSISGIEELEDVRCIFHDLLRAGVISITTFGTLLACTLPDLQIGESCDLMRNKSGYMMQDMSVLDVGRPGTPLHRRVYDRKDEQGQ